MKKNKTILVACVLASLSASVYAVDLVTPVDNTSGTYDSITITAANDRPAIRNTIGGSGQTALVSNSNIAITGPADKDRNGYVAAIYNGKGNMDITAAHNVSITSNTGVLVDGNFDGSTTKTTIIGGKNVEFTNTEPLSLGYANISVPTNNSLIVKAGENLIGTHTTRPLGSNPARPVATPAILAHAGGTIDLEAANRIILDNKGEHYLFGSGQARTGGTAKGNTSITAKAQNITMISKGSIVNTGELVSSPRVKYATTDVNFTANEKGVYQSDSNVLPTFNISGGSTMHMSATEGNTIQQDGTSQLIATRQGGTIDITSLGKNEFKSNGDGITIKSAISGNNPNAKLTISGAENTFDMAGVGILAMAGRIGTATVDVTALEGNNEITTGGTTNTGSLVANGDHTAINVTAVKGNNWIKDESTNERYGTVMAVGEDAKVTVQSEAGDTTIISKNTAVKTQSAGAIDIKAQNTVLKSAGSGIVAEGDLRGNGNAGIISVSSTTDDGRTTIIAERGDGIRVAQQGAANVQQVESITVGNPSEQHAIRAGVINTLTDMPGHTEDDEPSGAGTINLTYAGEAYTNGRITADAGTATIQSRGKDGDMVTVSGNVYAINDGTVHVSLSKDSTWVGQGYNFGDLATDTEDVRDAAVTDPARTPASSIAKPASYIANELGYKGFSKGTINLELQDNATWDVTNHSSINTLSGTGNVRISSDTTKGHAVQVETLAGTNHFVVNLDTQDNAANSDMIYVKNGASGQTLSIRNQNEIIDKLQDQEYIRVATIVNSGNNEFGADNATLVDLSSALQSDRLFFTYSKGALAEDTDEAYNRAYNGTAYDESKPGHEYVAAHYGVGAAVTNYYLTRRMATTDTARVLPRLGQAMYGRITDLDNLNKRLGEARYMNEDSGIWTRLRYDRIGKDNSYSTRGKTVELGYDWKNTNEDMKTIYHRGASFRYTWDSVDFTDLGDKDSNIKTWSVGFYDTKMSDNGFYHDITARVGNSRGTFQLDNPFATGKEKHTFYQIGAEVGKKYQGNKGWFYEPQAQLQYTHIRGDQFTTSNGATVDVDTIDSLIGRLGIRVGREFGADRRQSVYGYANVVHEFLGDQTLHAFAGRHQLAVDTEHGGTWLTIGIGANRQMNDDTSIFLDAEKTIGNDFVSTYRINAGLEFKL